MDIVSHISKAVSTSIQDLFNLQISSSDVVINTTRTDFEGDYTVVLFTLVKQLKKSPKAIGNELGNSLHNNFPDLIQTYNVIKGFLNLTVSDSFLTKFLEKHAMDTTYGLGAATDKTIMVEYASPNSNKPLHLGHLRNIFFGWSVSEILKAQGNKIIKTSIVNNRGIHICKSMVAWQLFGAGKTPQTENQKGDHFVGDYYVHFNDELKKQTDALKSTGVAEKEAEQLAPIMQAARQMLLDWELGKPEVLSLWNTMNSWVYAGFDETYNTIGCDFDRIYYESDTYLLGKTLVESGLQKGVFYKKKDGSVWIDLTAEGLDEKIVQRSDGTAVYITQDIGLAQNKYNEYQCDESFYVVADEQNYHFKVLKLICEKLQLPNAENIHHLSYGMVELPEGKMKSREGTVVDADEIVNEVIQLARQATEQSGKLSDLSEEELQKLSGIIGLGALKFFLLRVDPKKRMIFNPAESIDLHGFTGPFVQYTYARIQSIFKKNDGDANAGFTGVQTKLLPLEKTIAMLLEQFPATIHEAATAKDPSKIALYVFNLAKAFNTFYAEHSINKAESEEKKYVRLQLAKLTAHNIKLGMHLLGIQVPERM